MINSTSEIATSDIKLRKAIYSVFDGTCFYTGRRIPFEEIHIDHILPKSSGGKNNIENYVLCCGYINRKKNGNHTDEFVERVVQINKLIFVGKVVSEYNNLEVNHQIEESMININDFLRNYNFSNHPKRVAFVQLAKRNLEYLVHRPQTKGYGRLGLSTKKRFYFDKATLEKLFKKFLGTHFNATKKLPALAVE